VSRVVPFHAAILDRPSRFDNHPGTMMTDDHPTPHSPLALAAASFLAQALDLGDDPAAIATELTPVADRDTSAIFSVELDSSIGAAAFLVYVYVLADTDGEGTTGAELYQRGVATLEQAAARDTPGPRLVANAETDTVAFILATTPATWRRLQGDEPTMVATEADLPATGMSIQQRASLAEDLHRSLKEANEHARGWLGAIRAAGASGDGVDIAFTEEETALALHVLDEANVTPLLTALNLLIASAQEQAGKVLSQQPENP
jgi:hypothetical protein